MVDPRLRNIVLSGCFAVGALAGLAGVLALRLLGAPAQTGSPWVAGAVALALAAAGSLVVSRLVTRQAGPVAPGPTAAGPPEAASAEEQETLRAIVDSAAEGVIFADADGRVAFCNASAERIWGVSSKDVAGRALEEIHGPELRGAAREMLARARRERGFAAAEEADAPTGRYLNHYVAVHAPDGRYLGLAMLSEPASDRAKLELEHKRLRDQLFQHEKMVVVGEIAASVAHELNTPLGTILLRAQLVLRQQRDSQDLADLKVIESEAQRCRRIIDSLLSFARRSEGAMANTDIDSLIRDSLFLVERDLSLKGVAVEYEPAAGDGTVCVDANQIQQVLLNLITNASDAMPDGGRLTIQTRLVEDENVLEVRVRDTGCGMDREVLARAFAPFYSTKQRGKGTGLGLAICRRIVEDHQGRIELESRPGRGTTVSFRLPHVPVEVPAGE